MRAGTASLPNLPDPGCAVQRLARRAAEPSPIRPSPTRAIVPGTGMLPHGCDSKRKSSMAKKPFTLLVVVTLMRSRPAKSRMPMKSAVAAPGLGKLTLPSEVAPENASMVTWSALLVAT